MRWFLINCLLLAALASSETRQKRDLNYLRNLLTWTLFGRRNIPSPPSLDIEPDRLFRVPSLGNKLFQVVTKQNPGITSHPMILFNEKYNEAPQITKIGTFPRIANTGERVHVIPNESDAYDAEYKVNVPFEPKYSYKQLQNNEPVMTYTAHSNYVTTNPTIKDRTALPNCIKQRIDEVVLIGADPYRVEPVRNMFSIQTHPSINIKYSGDMGNQMRNYLKLPEINHRELGDNNMILRPKVTKQISAKLIPLFNSDQFNVPYNPIMHPVINMNEPIGGDKTVGLIPPPYIPYKAGIDKNEDNKQNRDIKINGVKLANTPVTNQPLYSSYMYKQVNNNSPNPTTVVRVGNQLDTNPKDHRHSHTPSLRDYVFVPPKVYDPQDSHTVISESEPNDSDIGPRIDKRKDKKLNQNNYFKNNPIIVSDDKIKTFSYHKKNIDGSSISINGSKNGVSVDLENSTVLNNRGDIPD